MRIVLLVFLLVMGLSPAAKPPNRTEVLIIGAGLSGLATAYELKQAGVRYHILEILPKIGGRVRTVRYERKGELPIYADSGMEEFWESNPAVKILTELKLPTRSDIALSSIVIEKQLVTLGKDETARQFYSRLFGEQGVTALNKFKAKIQPWIEQLKSPLPVRDELMALKDIAFSAFVSKENLPPRVKEWIRVSIECEIGTSWEKISALDGLAEFHIFLGEGEKAYRVLGGNDRFTDVFSRAVGLENISLNKKVNRVTRKDKTSLVSYLDALKNQNKTIEASYVVSTIPLYRLFEVQFDPPLSELKQQAISTMTWGAYFKAHVFVPPTAERFWTRDGASVLPILSDSELGVVYDGNPDQKGTRILSLLISGETAEKFNLSPLDQVRIQIQAGLEKLWPGFSKEIREIEFYRYHPRAIASWPVGRSRFDDLSNEIRQSDHNVYLAGDFTESSHSDGAFISAKRVVREILADRARHILSKQYFVKKDGPP